ncbi:GDP-mannose 4,6-dehydratase [Granulicella arctica]|uniref:GDP-mannose 4,6-dehydratase n=1 Tax=Granulicella arctica TaxID=940613 RepID=UPI0021E04FAC|nr:GDP-mannose 4,6-dehydratase [Granulicella arctica]
MKDRKQRIILITGGAGFIGSNLTERLLREPGVRVRVFDNLSRPGVEHNLAWLQGLNTSDRLEFVQGDVRYADEVCEAAHDADEIYHLAAQVAVTTSIYDPRADFEVNVAGTFHVLEAARRSGRRPFLLFTSTNKVYGSLYGVPVQASGSRYVASDKSFRGVKESEALDFHSPYGCSKGAADQYVRDYARIYNLPSVVFRMSCIAGPRQFGTEDQGWVAHFLYSVLERRPITVYGDGLQVRDILHVHDLIDGMMAARREQEHTAGEIYNLGGGLERAISIIEMLDAIADETGIRPLLRYDGIRPGDQPLYISDTSKLTAHTGWQARRSCVETLKAIHGFWSGNRALLAGQRSVAAESVTSKVEGSSLVAEEVA